MKVCFLYQVKLNFRFSLYFENDKWSQFLAQKINLH